ncbi:hypothetical protein BDN72DRAFT_849858 [Pluteus cervinus]|uniref:Uncharacterized protein n=1 Tax=Pluteus cervinus TaxID=181527 RepID=A0ACD3A6F3_9AGAR|nr:hypothetical protein BDN72DRAFT_849858 [Pluteus cervinus]
MDHLPVEVILKILRGSTDTDLFVFAQISRYLNSVATSHYLRRHTGVQRLDSVSLIFDGSRVISRMGTYRPAHRNPSVDILAFLSLAFDIKNLDQFVWEFLDPDFPNSFRTVIRHLHRLTAFLRRLESVRRVSLKMHQWTALLLKMMLRSGLLDEWTVAITDLFNACIEKLKMDPEGAEAFEVVDGFNSEAQCSLEDDPSRGIVGRVLERLMGTRDLTEPCSSWTIDNEGARFPMLNPNIACPLSSGARSVSELTKKFKISSTAFFDPPFFEWTYRFISFAPLISLALENLSYTAMWWEVIFSWLAVPLQHCLEELTIRECDHIQGLPLAEFLRNLRCLKHCIITESLLYSSPPDFVPFNLPNLVSLAASSHFLSIIRPKGFQAWKRLLNIPSPLTTLRIFPSHGYPTGFPVSITAVLEAYSNVPWIILDLNLNSRFHDFAISSDRCGGLRSRLRNQYGLVKELVISKDMISSVTKNFEDLAVFEGLKVFRVVGDAVRTTGGDDLENKDGWIHSIFLELLKRQCPSLELVKLEGADGEVVVHDLR